MEGRLMSTAGERDRVLSGMRPTGRLHLGHYHGVLKNWVHLQDQFDSFFFVADWHALTTHYEDPEIMAANVWDMVVDWLASGIDPDRERIEEPSSTRAKLSRAAKRQLFFLS